MFRNAYLLLCLTTLFWGGNAVAGKLAVGHISPMVLTSIRWAMAAAIMLVIGLPQLRRDWPIVRAHMGMIFALGAVGFTLFNGVFYVAVQYTSVINVAIEQAGMPMLIFVFNFILYRMGVALGQIVGFSLSFLGVALTAAHGDLTTLAQLDINRGDALMMLAILLYAGYTVALRYKPALHWKSLMLAMCVSAFIASLPLAAWEMMNGDAILPDWRGLSIAAYTAIFPSILSQAFYMRGVELIGPNRAGLFINLVPIFGTLLSIMILGEAFHAYHAVALVMVLGGIWMAENSGRKMAG